MIYQSQCSQATSRPAKQSPANAAPVQQATGSWRNKQQTLEDAITKNILPNFVPFIAANPNTLVDAVV